MEQLLERVERYLTLPELLDALNVDYEEALEVTLEDLLKERKDDIEDLLEDYGDC